MKNLKHEILALKKDIEVLRSLIERIENGSQIVDIEVKIGVFLRFDPKKFSIETEEFEKSIISGLKKKVLSLEEELEKYESELKGE